MRTTPIRSWRGIRLTAAALLLASASAHAQFFPPGFNDEIILGGLEVPTEFLFTPDGRMLIATQQGKILVFDDGTLLSDPMLVLPVEVYREQGLLGMALDPTFPNSPYLYVVYTPFTGRPSDNFHRVSRFTINGNTIPPQSEEVIFDEIPTGIGFHVGGCIRFGLDGNLLISTGDTGWAPPYPADLSRLEGKILRLQPDGRVPPDNPFFDVPGARREIYQYGLRNPFRISVQPGTGQLFIGDVGASDWEEINTGPPGANFGWPLYEGLESSPDSMTVDPLFAYDHSNGTAAVVGSTFYTGDNFPVDCLGNLFFLDHARGTLGRMVLDANNQIVSCDPTWIYTTSVGAGFGPVSLVQGPDGALYYSTYIPGQIHRIYYTGTGNRRPNAFSSASPTSGYPLLDVSFVGAASYDVDGDSLSYEWDFGDGSPHSSAKNPVHSYSAPFAVFQVRLTVRDSRGAESTAPPIVVTLGNLPPSVSIAAPQHGARFLPDELIQFQGSAIDPENGPVPDSQLHWKVFLHHLEHVHPVILDQVGASGSFEAIFHGEETGDIFYRITAWAQDAGGLQGEKSVDVFPDPNPPSGIVRTLEVPADDRDAVSVSDTVRVRGYNEGKRYDQVSSDGERQCAAIQFLLDLPRNANVSQAKLIVNAGPFQSASPTGSMIIHMYDVADATPFADGALENLLAHHPTDDSTVAWSDSVDWTPTNDYNSPEVSMLVRRFLARSDYVPGRHIGFVVTKGTMEVDRVYGWADYAAGTLPPRLRLVYTVPTDVAAGPPPQAPLALDQNLPNPFNPSTRIHFRLEHACRARLRIHDVTGRVLRTLVDAPLEAGDHTIVWDGRNSAGHPAASGLYIYTLDAGDRSRSRRMVLLR